MSSLLLSLYIFYHNLSELVKLWLSFYHKKLAEEFKGQFCCLEENTEKYITFPVSIEKKVKRTGKNGKKITKIISYRLQLIDRARFMASSLSNLANNLIYSLALIKVRFHRFCIDEFTLRRIDSRVVFWCIYKSLYYR